MAAAKKADLLMILGPKKASKPAPAPESDSESSEYGGEFDSAASEAFPDMSPEQKDAFWRAVAACVDRLKGEE